MEKITRREDAEKTCFTCACSAVDDCDRLHCLESGEIVNDDDTCEDWN